MSTGANERSNLAPAPMRLWIVQELINTAPSGRIRPTVDLLATRSAAAQWLASIDPRLDLPSHRLNAAELTCLVRLREYLRNVIAARDDHAIVDHLVEATVSVDVDATGIAHVAPHGAGAQAIRGLIFAELLLAQARGDWQRLKSVRTRHAGLPSTTEREVGQPVFIRLDARMQ